MVQKSAGVSRAHSLSALLVFVLCLLAGCVSQRDMAGPVTDPDFTWVRAGFSVQAPYGRNWYRLPANKGNPNSVEFQEGEGLFYAVFSPQNLLYLKGANVFAFGVVLGEHLGTRRDKESLAPALRKQLERYLLSMRERLGSSVFDPSLGADCLKYDATSTVERIPVNNVDMHIDGIHGYFCLHPDIDNFAVLMQTNSYATVWTDIHQKENRSTFFKSLRFLPVSSSVPRFAGR